MLILLVIDRDIPGCITSSCLKGNSTLGPFEDVSIEYFVVVASGALQNIYIRTSCEVSVSCKLSISCSSRLSLFRC